MDEIYCSNCHSDKIIIFNIPEEHLPQHYCMECGSHDTINLVQIRNIIIKKIKNKICQ